MRRLPGANQTRGSTLTEDGSDRFTGGCFDHPADFRWKERTIDFLEHLMTRRCTVSYG
jgi:hypothetical protein